jgi:hypothetical protein
MRTGQVARLRRGEVPGDLGLAALDADVALHARVDLREEIT